jgi:hypothetical protein
LFKPKIYKSNGIEAYRLISDDGGSFLYEGRIEYSEDELYKDEHGRAYYLVTSDMGSPSRYYVEVEPEGKPLPGAHKKEKAISSLIVSSPRPGAEKKKTAEHDVAPPSRPPEEKKPADVSEEAQAAVKAMASLGGHKPRKNKKPIYIILFCIVALIAIAAGIYVYKPGLISGLTSIWKPTEAPAITATPVPSPTPSITPSPTAGPLPGGPDIYRRLLAIAPAIDSSNESIEAFVKNNSNPMGTSLTSLARLCDVFDLVNKKWVLTDEKDKPQNASESVLSLSGSTMDYSILMAALAEAGGMESRVVAVYHEDTNSYAYYPEVMAAPNDTAYYDVKVYLRARYNVTEPYGQADGTRHWLSLSMGKAPGGYVDSKYGYAVNSRKEISPV